MSTTTAPATDQSAGKRRPLDRQQRAYLYAADRQQRIGRVLLALECAAEKATPRRAGATKAPTTLAPLSGHRRRQPAVCPSQGRYRRHRAAGETCAECTAFMRTKWRAFRAAHPEWRERSQKRYRDATAARKPKPDITTRLEQRAEARAERIRTRRTAVARYREQRETETATRRAAVMAQFIEDAA